MRKYAIRRVASVSRGNSAWCLKVVQPVTLEPPKAAVPVEASMVGLGLKEVLIPPRAKSLRAQ